MKKMVENAKKKLKINTDKKEKNMMIYKRKKKKVKSMSLKG